MIIYNTTFNVSLEVEAEFIEFLKQEYVLDCLNTRLVRNPKFMKLLGDLPDEGSTYSLQFNCNDLNDYIDFETNHAPSLQESIINRYGEDCLFFTSTLEVIW